MTDALDPNEDPAVTGVPSETPDQIRPSATGVVTGPLDDETDIVVARVDAGGNDSPDAGQVIDPASLDQTLQDAEGGIEGSADDEA